MTNIESLRSTVRFAAMGGAVWSALLCALGSASGCADAGLAEEAAPGQVGVTSQMLLVPDPNGVYFAEVIANGTGCPQDTWHTEISDDGKTFTTTFSEYETIVEPGKLVSIKDCQLAIKLHSPQGLSFSVESFYYGGYAFLESNVVGRQTANYYFQGNPVDSVGLRTDLVGPYDDDYLFQDDIGVADLVWSPCGLERDLNVTTRIRLQNNRSKTGTGYMNTTAADGSASLILRLGWRSC